MQGKERSASERRLDTELFEFTEMFPDTDLDDIPDTVWQRVKEGVTLAGAYGEYVKQIEESKALAKRANEKNKGVTPGPVAASGRKAVFTARDVQKMTKEQVKKHYAEILESMEAEGFYN